VGKRQSRDALNAFIVFTLGSLHRLVPRSDVCGGAIAPERPSVATQLRACRNSKVRRKACS